MGPTTIKEMNAILVQLNLRLKDIKNLSEKGLVEGMIHIRRETESVAPVTPVDLGNLRASWFIVSKSGVAKDIKKSGQFRNGPDRAPDLAARMRTDYVDHINQAKSIVSNSKDPHVIAGYSAHYATIVHEMIHADFSGEYRRKKGNKKRGGMARQSGPKWFETAIKRNQKRIFVIASGGIRKRMITMKGKSW